MVWSFLPFLFDGVTTPFHSVVLEEHTTGLQPMGMLHQNYSEVGQSLREVPKSIRILSSLVLSGQCHVCIFHVLKEIQTMLNMDTPPTTCQDN